MIKDPIVKMRDFVTEIRKVYNGENYYNPDDYRFDGVGCCGLFTMDPSKYTPDMVRTFSKYCTNCFDREICRIQRECCFDEALNPLPEGLIAHCISSGNDITKVKNYIETFNS